MLEERLLKEQVFQFMEQNNITPRDRNMDLIMDGQLHRFSVEGDRGREEAGAYVIHNDEWPAWAVMDYHKHDEMIKGKFNPDNLRAYERDEFFAQLRKSNTPQIQSKKTDERKRQEQHQEKMRAEAVARAWREYNDTNNSCISEHPYAKLKHISESRMLNYEGRIKINRREGDYGQVWDLMIPLYNAETGKFQSMQLIRGTLNTDGKYQKGIYKDTQVTGACFRLKPYEDKRPDMLLICEGVATAASLFKAFNFEVEVIAAMNCHNIINVARAFRKKYPDRIITIAADNDTAGIKAAEKTKEAGYADKIILPPEQGMDWNDYYIQKGII